LETTKTAVALTAVIAGGEQAANEQVEQQEEDDEDDLLFDDCVSLPAPDVTTLVAIRHLRSMLRPEDLSNARADVRAARQQLRASIAQAQKQGDALAAIKVETAAAAAAAAATAATAATAAATAAAAAAAAASGVATAAAAATAQEEQLEQEQQQQQELELEPEPTPEAVAGAQQGGSSWTPASKRGERLTSSPPGDEPPSPAVRLRRFQLLECVHSSGDTTVIDRDKSKPHTHTFGARPTSGMSL
jgi:hypothetical protein